MISNVTMYWRATMQISARRNPPGELALRVLDVVLDRIEQVQKVYSADDTTFRIHYGSGHSADIPADIMFTEAGMTLLYLGCP